MEHLSEILRRLTQATRLVARNHGIKRFPVTQQINTLAEAEAMEAIRQQILFLEQPHLAYLMFPQTSELKFEHKAASAGQPRCGPPLLNFGIRL